MHRDIAVYIWEVVRCTRARADTKFATSSKDENPTVSARPSIESPTVDIESESKP